MLKRRNYILLFWLVFIGLVIVVHIVWIKNTQQSSLLKLSLIDNTLKSVFQKYQYLPELLSHDPRLKLAIDDNDYGIQLNDKLKAMQVSAGVDSLYLMNNKGVVIASSNYNKANSFMNRKYDFRPYFKESMSEGSGLYYGVGITTKIPGYFISSQIKGFNTGTGVIVAKVEPSSIEQSWQQLSGDVFVTDNNGVVIMSANKNWKYNSLTQLSPKQLKDISRQRQFAGKVPKLIVNDRLDIDIAGVSLREINGQRFLIESVQLESKENTLLRKWRLYYAVPFNAVIEKTIYSSLIIALLLYGLYIFINHRHFMADTRALKAKIDKQHRADMHLIIDKTKVGILTIDKMGDILSHNAIFQEMSDQSCSSAITGRSISEFVPLPEKLDEATNITEAFTETTLKQKNTSYSLPIMFVISPINIGNSAYLMTIVDISKRKKAEESLSFANAQLEKLVEERTLALDLAQKELILQEKMVVLGRMAAAIVHELSQPLVAFKSALASIAIKQQRSDWVGVNYSLNNLSPLCNNMQDILIQLKSFAYQGGQNQTQHIELNDLIRRLLDSYLDEYSNIITVNLTKQPMMIKVNVTKVEIAIGNLVRNAIDAVKTAEQPKVSIFTKILNNHVMITVEDNGIGFDENIAEHIFEPFFTTKSIGKGLGLGLPITNNIIKECSGSIEVECIDDLTRFTILLPMS